MSLKVVILVGSMSGTAELVADVVLDQVEEAGHEGRIVRMEKVGPEHLAKGGVFIICTSTYGTGEVPDNAKPLFSGLADARPDLSTVRYGVFALGDSVYPATFCFGGLKFDELLASLGAQRVGEVRQHDSRGAIFPEDAASEWIGGWLKDLEANVVGEGEEP